MNVQINLKELMKKKWIKAIQLAELTWLTPSQISKIKNGKPKKIELHTIDLLLKALDCSPNDLIIITND